MRTFSVAVLATVATIFGSSGVAVAAPKDYCADLKGGNTGTACVIQLSDPAYSVDISIPLDYPDQKSVADYVSQTRDAFLNTAKSGAPANAVFADHHADGIHLVGSPARHAGRRVQGGPEPRRRAVRRRRSRRSTGTRAIARRSSTRPCRTTRRSRRCGGWTIR